MDTQRDANLLGALALALSDDFQAAVRRETGLSPTACAVVATLGPYPGQTISEIARVIGVTHSVAVRVVDHLVQRGFIARAPGADRRQVTLQLTSEGTALRETIMAARHAVLVDALEVLSAEERAHLEPMISVMLVRLTSSRAKADHLCRLCDEDVCTPDTCPVELEAMRQAITSDMPSPAAAPLDPSPPGAPQPQDR